MFSETSFRKKASMVKEEGRRVTFQNVALKPPKNICKHTQTRMYIYINIYAHSRASVYIYIYTYLAPHCIALHYIALHYATLHHTTLHYITSHHIASHYTALHHVTCITNLYIYAYVKLVCIFFSRASLRFAQTVPMFIHRLACFPNVCMGKEMRQCELVWGSSYKR